MNQMKKFCNRLFIDGLSGMALGLFSTLIVGTIIQQIGIALGGEIGNYLFIVGKVAASVTGAGIGCGVAYKLKENPLVVLSAATTGMVGAFASKILVGSVFADGVIHFAGPGEPLGAFVAAFVGIEVGRLISGKTKIDILITPLLSILCGSTMGLVVGPPISKFMTDLGAIINWATDQHKFVMGIVVAVLVGMFLTLPISSAAICIILNLSGIAAGAATVGCCANMVGFAVASYRENKAGGLLAQGLGTSMLQVPNIVRNPRIWVPAILTSAVLGPISTCVVGLTNNATGAGMGTCGLIGQIMTYQTMAPVRGSIATIFLILIMQIIMPAALAYVISEWMRHKNWIKFGDMKLDV
ncbi:MAG: PTS transporter subunit IIC [Velocimicrobium sp.]